MSTIYKLTDQKMQTHGGYQWVLNEQREVSGTGELCTGGWLHAYSHPLLAMLLNSLHANFQNPRLFKAHGGGKTKRDGQLKLGVTKLTLIEEMPLPEISTEMRVKFAILCAQKVIGKHCPEWSAWAKKWLAGTDRSERAAYAAADAAARKLALKDMADIVRGIITVEHFEELGL